MAGNVKGPANYMVAFAGFVLAYTGLKNYSVVATLQDVIGGKKPGSGPGYTPGTAPGMAPVNTEPVPTRATQGPVNVQALAKQMLAAHGWSDQWKALNSLVLGESGWNPVAENQTTNAFGIAQALGHGTASTVGRLQYTKGLRRGQLVNMYGGEGLSDAEAQLANSGDAAAQIKWLGAYIADRYGSPDAAEQFKRAHNYY